MVEHICLHEGDFGTFKNQLSSIEKKQDKTLDTIDKLFNRIEGKNGITSEIAILKTQYKLAPSTRALVFYASIGGGCTSIVLGIIVLVAKAWGWE